MMEEREREREPLIEMMEERERATNRKDEERERESH